MDYPTIDTNMPTLILEVFTGDRDAVLNPPPFPDQPCARNGTKHWPGLALGRIAGSVLFGHGLKAFQRFPAEAAIGQFLNAVGEPAFQKAPIVGGGLGIKQFAPSGLQDRSRGAPPLFVDLAIRRWQVFTGEKAIRESDGAYFEVLDQAAQLPEPAS